MLVEPNVFLFTEEQREHGPVVRGGQTGGPFGQQPAQIAGVWHRRLSVKLVHSVPVVRGHEAHEIGTCTSTSTVTRCVAGWLAELLLLLLLRRHTSPQLCHLPTAPRLGFPKLLYQPSKRGISQVISQRESVQHTFQQRFLVVF